MKKATLSVDGIDGIDAVYQVVQLTGKVNLVIFIGKHLKESNVSSVQSVYPNVVSVFDGPLLFSLSLLFTLSEYCSIPV